MTSIAYKEGLLSADSACTGGQTYYGSITKMARRASDGALAAGAGHCANIAEFLAWFERNDGSKLELSPPAQFEGIIVLSRHKVLLFGDHGVAFPLRAKCHGIGTGARIVLAAMAAGASAPRAVRIACGLDTDTRGPVHTLKLGG